MIIKDLVLKSNNFLRSRGGGDFFVALLIILTATMSFGLGVLSERSGEERPIKLLNEEAAVLLTEKELNSGEVVTVPERSPGGQVVASKNGSKYHFPWCSGAQRMKEENKIWFESIEEARNSGYTPAGNCKGLE